MPDENILVIAVDGLRAAALGAYGNTSYSTPALDQFAADSRLFDWCFADAVELPAIYRSLWQGDGALIRSLADCGYATTQLTDDPALESLAGFDAFQDSVRVPLVDPIRAKDLSQTAFARLFTAAIEQIEAAQPGPRLLWVHSQGMYGPWDAPLELQEDLLAREEGDPPPADELQPPNLALDEASDPDVAFRWSCAYAAQVMALDACIAGVCEAIDTAGREKWQVLLVGVRGFPLGEHGQIGGVDGRLYIEQLQVPLVCRFADRRHALSRSGQLVSLADLPQLLLDTGNVLQLPRRNELFVAGPNGERSVRTAEWSLRCDSAAADSSSTDEDSRCQLFVRPDDRWEANDIAALCPDAVEELLARLAATPAS